MNPAAVGILTVNAGSSSIKFAFFDVAEPLTQTLAGNISGIGLSTGTFGVKCSSQTEAVMRQVAIPDQASAVNLLMDWIQEQVVPGSLSAVGHRFVHGGSKYWEAQRITARMLRELHALSAFDPEHLPGETLLAEALQHRFPEVPQVACFDTAFHHDMPRVARILPIPRRYGAQGVRRYGFHGLSYAYLMQELVRVAGVKAANGRLILAHLGSGASIAAVCDGHSIDTSMGFTPTAGLVMGTRSGDLDPGLISFLAHSDNITAARFGRMVNHESGLLGVSETSSDMRVLLSRETEDVRAAEAVELFCYQAKKWIGAYAAVLCGLDTLVFAGGIGENSPAVRARICAGLGFLGIEMDEERNTKAAEIVSSHSSRVTIRVIPTNEELMIATSVHRIIGHDGTTKE